MVNHLQKIWNSLEDFQQRKEKLKTKLVQM